MPRHHHRFLTRLLLPLVAFLLCQATSVAADASFPLTAKRILFLGDSITHDGRYVSWIETQLRLHDLDPRPELINVGLGSETCSGLSEPDHPFPRPDVHERVDRALQKVKPDVVVACYGMNDGIYHPFSETRFQAFQDGVNRLITKVHRSGAKLILMTPPPFDPVPLRGQDKLLPAGEGDYAYFAIYEDYDNVLRRYGAWLMQQGDRVAMVIDLHKPLRAYTEERRKEDSQFTLAPDGIHPNAQGHQILGDTILRAWGLERAQEPDAELLQAVHRRSKLLHDAWLTEIGHQRPGVAAGLPLEQAERKAEELNAQIEQLLEMP